MGILNLNDEAQRPEEQAYVVQATVEAVRTLTMVLQTNLSSLSDNSLINSADVYDFKEETPEFLQSE